MMKSMGGLPVTESKKGSLVQSEFIYVHGHNLMKLASPKSSDWKRRCTSDTLHMLFWGTEKLKSAFLTIK